MIQQIDDIETQKTGVAPIREIELIDPADLYDDSEEEIEDIVLGLLARKTSRVSKEFEG